MVMTLKQLEAEVKKLKKQVAEGAYAKDYLDIWKLMSIPTIIMSGETPMCRPCSPRRHQA